MSEMFWKDNPKIDGCAHTGMASLNSTYYRVVSEAATHARPMAIALAVTALPIMRNSPLSNHLLPLVTHEIFSYTTFTPYNA